MTSATDDEFAFWAPQIIEHAFFVSLGLVEPRVRALNEQLRYLLSEAFRTQNVPQFTMLTDQSVRLKSEALKVIRQGQWIGWSYPSFFQHMIDEEIFFLQKLAGKMSPTDEIRFWLQERAGENDVASHLIDPSEVDAEMRTKQAAGKFRAILGRAGPAMASQALNEGHAMNAALEKMTPASPLSLISPMLRDHVLREGRRFVQSMERITKEEKV